MSYLRSERHFRRYESYIIHLVRNYPNMVKFKPQPPVYSVETLASRIRICIKALFENIRDGSEKMWDTGVDNAKFLQMMDDVVVSTTAEPGYVVCGPSDKVRKVVPLGVQMEPVIEQVIPKVHLRSDAPVDLVKAILVLHHHKMLNEPSIISTDLDLFELSKGLDVAVERDGNVYTIL